jgi:hypothetical protein
MKKKKSPPTPVEALDIFLASFDEAAKRLDRVTRVSREIVRAKAEDAREAVKAGEEAVRKIKRLFSL